MRRKILSNPYVKKHIHNAIVWYLKRCGGAFHNGPYGENGKYVALMSDDQYGRYQNVK